MWMRGEVGLVGKDFNSPDNRDHCFKTKELIFFMGHTVEFL